MAQHTGEHKYSCTFCPKKFASPGNYHSHRKRMHAEEHQNERLMKQKEQFVCVLLYFSPIIVLKKTT